MKSNIVVILASITLCASAENVDGIYGRRGDHESTYIDSFVTGNYLTGVADAGPTGDNLGSPEDIIELRSYFVFNLASTSFGPVTSAHLNLRSGNWGAQAGPTETISLWDVSATVAELRSETANSTTFSDLGSGISYGSTTLTTVPVTGLERGILALNTAGIAAINSALGIADFKIGASLASFGVGSANQQSDYVFGSTGDPGDVELDIFDALGNMKELTIMTVPVPEPSIYAVVFGLGLVGFAIQRRRVMISMR